VRLAGALLLSAQIALAVGAASPTLSQRTDAERAEQAKRDAEKAKAVAAVEKAAAALKAAYVALGKAVISSDANAISKA